ncbi:MAG: aspartate/glutamate racemase family protein [Burkholderiales bacterium]
MKIWYQAYNASGEVDPAWRYFDEAVKRYVPTVARADTEIRFSWVEKRAPKMVVSKYIQYLHVGQLIESAMRAEREGYDAFVLGGMRDLGYAELREAVDIPVIFMGETSYLLASLLAGNFAIINPDEASLQDARSLLTKYGLTERCAAGVHTGHTHTDLIAACERAPERLIEDIRAAARTAAKGGGRMIVMGFAALSVFLAERGIRDIDGVPVLDSQAAVIKAAEMMVDFRKLGVPKPKSGLFDLSKADIEIARKRYGLE